jgi:oligopeptidase A
MEEILALRHEQSKLASFENYAQYSLATKMAESPGQVIDFLTDLAVRARPAGQSELADLQTFAKTHDGLESLQTWDLPYYSERLKRERYHLSAEDPRPYFPAPAVIEGLFKVVNRLYALEIREEEDTNVWHPDVTVYTIRDHTGDERARFYLDLYARENKRGGAWMADCISRRRTATGIQRPVAFVTCNFAPPMGGKPALLTHDDVITLFHEFGHSLHHMLTKVDYAGVSGIAGVPWDAVELPSQFMENWCWEREALDLFAAHYETGEPLPKALFQRMHAARNYHAAMGMLRQLEFSLFDFRLHRDYDPVQGARIQEVLNAVRSEVAVVQPPPFNRFANSFAHIFAGGYAAGYYSYKWAEVLSADAFSAFEEAGIFDRTTGKRFLTAVLERGGSREAMVSFVDFRGRKPSIEPLLRHNGLKTNHAA